MPPARGPLVLLTGYTAPPERVRRFGEARLASWLAQRKVRDAAGVAARAITAASAQMTVLPGQDLAATRAHRSLCHLSTNAAATMPYGRCTSPVGARRGRRHRR